MDNDVTIYDEQVPVFADDALVRIADQAEKRIDAVIKIKQVALKVTNGHDWVDQNGKPYLQASGAEKIANLFNISWRIDEPIFELEEDGHYTYSYVGTFSMGGRSIQIEGSRSSKDPFFRQYNWENGKKAEKAVYDRDNKRDVKMAALTNLLGNGITRLLGIRNLTYADLEAFADIKQSDIGKVEYKKEGKKASDSVRKKTGTTTTQAPANGEPVNITTGQLRAIYPMLKKLGVSEDNKHTFVAKTLGIKKPESLRDLTHAQGADLIKKLMEEKPEASEPIDPDVPKDCTKDPKTCDHSGFVSEDGKMVAYCGGDEKRCKYDEGK